MFEVGEDTAFFTSHSISGNTVNGKPLYYFVNETGLSVPADAGGVIAVNCDGITVVGLDVSDNSMGVELAYCSNVQMDTVTADRCGIFGVYLAHCSQGSLENITCTETNHGIDVRACKNIGIQDCATVDCEQGIFLSFALDCIVDRCIIRRCGNGFFIAMGNNNQIADSVIENNENGVYVQNEKDMLVRGNQINGNTVAGTRFLRSTGFVLDNGVQGNQTGVLAAEGDSITVSGNTFAENISAALYLRDLQSGQISVNVFMRSEKTFIEIDGTILNVFVWGNMFQGGQDQIIQKNHNDIPLANNHWAD